MTSVELTTALQVFQILSIAIGGLAVAYRIGSMTTRVEGSLKQQAKEISELQNTVKKLAEFNTTVALLDQRVIMMENRWEELRHGEGMVLPLFRATGEKR